MHAVARAPGACGVTHFIQGSLPVRKLATGGGFLVVGDPWISPPARVFQPHSFSGPRAARLHVAAGCRMLGAGENECKVPRVLFFH